MATLHHLSTHRLLSLAKKFQIRHAGDAAGRCLSVSLDFAMAASERLGVELQLVKWRVEGDPSYVDHWAVLLDRDTVIDLTHVQVDGNCRLTNPMSAYPAHFTHAWVYPAALLTAAYVASGAQGSVRLSNRFLWTCGTRLLRFDLAAAWRRRDAAAARVALREARTFLTCFGFSGLTHALDARAHTLLSRLKGQPGVCARATDKRDPGTSRASDPAAAPAAKLGIAAHDLAWAGVALSPVATASLSSACSMLLAYA